MSEMIERVAATLYLHRKQNYMDQARAAIEAMREPTERMFQHGIDATRSPFSPLEYWRTMIDGALK